MKTIIHWFRRDLRLSDNSSLYHAMQEADRVIPVFCLDRQVLARDEFGAASVQFMLDALVSLQKNLEAVGSRLIVRKGDSLTELVKLAKEVGASAIYWNRKYDPYTLPRDAAIERACHEQGVETKTFPDFLMQEPGALKTEQNKPYTVFTPFSKKWLTLPRPKVWARFQGQGEGLKSFFSQPLPLLKELNFSLDYAIAKSGEREAHEVLRQFLDKRASHYSEKRDFPALNATSHLSPHLRFGTISARTVYESVVNEQKKVGSAARRNMDVFLKELIWREFYVHVLYYFPHVVKGAFRSEYDQLKWSENQEHFQAWCDGKTGYPIVDAAMRQLNTTGWMHNRLRMIVAMFLTKDLHISWQWGEKYFLKKLMDGELAANNGGWQWSASTGTDAAPYFRIFSPISQSQKFDPQGEFIKKFVPELGSLSAEEIHASGKNIKDYPAPLVDHAAERVKTLELFKRIK
ncbi:MAG: DNA photolyase family protein [Verrucomicrobiae bacterium]|nr:DNA photolyase family protein [Verrucomicrobiae bacterium]